MATHAGVGHTVADGHADRSADSDAIARGCGDNGAGTDAKSHGDTHGNADSHTRADASGLCQRGGRVLLL